MMNRPALPIEDAPKDGRLLVCFGTHNTDSVGLWKTGERWSQILKWDEVYGWVTEHKISSFSPPEYFIPLETLGLP